MQDPEGAATRAKQAGAEKVALLELATLLYAQQGESCSLERGTRLLTSLGPLLTTTPTPISASGRPPQRVDHLVPPTPTHPTPTHPTPLRYNSTHGFVCA